MKTTFLALLLALTALTQQAYTQQLYTSPANGFSITFPAEWTVETYTEGSTEVKGKQGITEVFVTVKADESYKGKTIETVADDNFKSALIEECNAQTHNAQVLRTEFTVFNNMSAYNFIYTGDLFAGYRLVVSKYYIVSSGRLYCITSSTTVNDYSKAEAMINSALFSFTLN